MPISHALLSGRRCSPLQMWVWLALAEVIFLAGWISSGSLALGVNASPEPSAAAGGFPSHSANYLLLERSPSAGPLGVSPHASAAHAYTSPHRRRALPGMVDASEIGILPHTEAHETTRPADLPFEDHASVLQGFARRLVNEDELSAGGPLHMTHHRRLQRPERSSRAKPTTAKTTAEDTSSEVVLPRPLAFGTRPSSSTMKVSTTRACNEEEQMY